MNRFAFIFFVNCLCFIVYSNNCYCVTFHFVNFSDTDRLIIAEREPLLIIDFDTIKQTSISASIDTLVEEPMFYVIVINNEFNGYVDINEFILHSGKYDVYINIAERKISYNNSIINSQNQIVRKVLDSLEEPIMKFVHQLEMENDVIKVNKIDKIISEHNLFVRDYMYKWYLRHTDYYRALMFVNTYSSSKKDPKFNKRKLKKLFKRLNPSLRQYKLYKQTEEQLKRYTNRSKNPIVPTVKSNL